MVTKLHCNPNLLQLIDSVNVSSSLPTNSDMLNSTSSMRATQYLVSEHKELHTLLVELVHTVCFNLEAPVL